MKRILYTLLFLIILGFFAFQFQSKFTLVFPTLENLQKNIDAILAPAPCSQPIPYTLGTFDTQFGISKEYFVAALAEAEAIWEQPLGLNLFVYKPTDTALHDLKINLIYDYRQQATSKLASLGIVVKNDQASYDALKIQYTTLQAQYLAAKKDYELSKQEATRLKINEMVTEINALVVVLNQLAATLNISVNQYNTVNGARGESFEEGVYISDGLNKEIDVYEFSNRAKLVRVLAHELGHALGLDHVTDPKAIMYSLNQGNNEVLTQADLNELKIKCQIK
jgi:predicted Zn-dependent protease